MKGRSLTSSSALQAILLIVAGALLAKLTTRNTPAGLFQQFQTLPAASSGLVEGEQFEGSKSALARLLVVATFHWKATRLMGLEAMLHTVLSYPTQVQVILVTNNLAALSNVALRRGWGPQVQLHQPDLSSLRHPHQLAFLHRQVIKDTITADPGEYTDKAIKLE